MVSDAKREILLVTAFVLGLVAFMAWLMWPPVLSKLDARPKATICNENFCCNAHGCDQTDP